MEFSHERTRICTNFTKNLKRNEKMVDKGRILLLAFFTLLSLPFSSRFSCIIHADSCSFVANIVYIFLNVCLHKLNY